MTSPSCGKNESAISSLFIVGAVQDHTEFTPAPSAASNAGEELIQYLLIDRDLGMSGPKMSVQVAHASGWSVLHMSRTPSLSTTLDTWLASGSPKILLSATATDLAWALSTWPSALGVRDAGRTEIPGGSLTVVALPLLRRMDRPKRLARFQLMRDRT